MAADLRDTTFVNPHAGKTGRDGGPYLDQVEREAAEINRARVEGRDVDLANATFSVGVPATPDYVMERRPDVVSHPSMLADANAGSTNDGAEVLPVDWTTEAPENPDEAPSGSGSSVGEFSALGEITSTESASINSPLLVEARKNDPSANSDNNIQQTDDPINPPIQNEDELKNEASGAQEDDTVYTSESDKYSE